VTDPRKRNWGDIGRRETRHESRRGKGGFGSRSVDCDGRLEKPEERLGDGELGETGRRWKEDMTGGEVYKSQYED